MRKIINNFARKISRENKYSLEQSEQIDYVLRVFIFEFLKMAGVLLFFWIIGFGFQGLITISTMSVLKPFLGGYHEDTHLKCFIETIIIDGAIVYVSNVINLDILSKIILLSLSLYAISNQAPIINYNMPLTKEALIRKNRFIAITTSFIVSALSILLYKDVIISNIMMWTVVILAILMFNKIQIKTNKI